MAAAWAQIVELTNWGGARQDGAANVAAAETPNSSAVTRDGREWRLVPPTPRTALFESVVNTSCTTQIEHGNPRRA